MVSPGGTGSPALVISARPAPFPPRRSRSDAFPSRKSQTHFVPVPWGAVFSGAAVAIALDLSLPSAMLRSVQVHPLGRFYTETLQEACLRRPASSAELGVPAPAVEGGPLLRRQPGQAPAGLQPEIG